MTREDAKRMFPESTDEQITNFLNVYNAEVSPLKADKKKYDDAIEKARLYDESESSKLTEQEKLQQLIKDAEIAKATNLKALNRTKAESVLIGAGLTSDEYSTFIDGIISDNEENTITLATNLATAMKSKIENAQKTLKAEMLKSMPPPPGGSGGTEKTVAETVAENAAKTASASMKSSQEALKNIIGG